MTIHARVVDVLSGRKPERIPFIDRIDKWYQSHRYAGTLPEELKGKSLTEVHAIIGIGEQDSRAPCALRLRGVEMVVTLEDETIYHDTDPLMESFPEAQLSGFVPWDRPGNTVVDFITSIGKVSAKYQVIESMIAMGGWCPIQGSI
jgi:hypothetical protein